MEEEMEREDDPEFERNRDEEDMSNFAEGHDEGDFGYDWIDP